MRKLVNSALKWAPHATFGAAIAIATVWPQARDWIGERIAWAVRAMAHPLTDVGVIIFLVFYAGAVIWSEHEIHGPKHRLYLANPFESDGKRVVEYLTAWSPSRYLWFPFSDYETWARTANPDPRRRILMGFDLSNPGPEEAFHVRLQWKLKGANAFRSIKKANLFGDSLDSLSKNRLALCTEDIGYATFKIATADVTEIPNIKSGDVIRINLPEPLNNALALVVLTEAKSIMSSPVGDMSGIKAAFAQLIRDTKSMPIIYLKINYVTERGKKVKLNFLVKGLFHGRGALFRPVEGREDHFEIEPNGITAWISNLQIARK